MLLLSVVAGLVVVIGDARRMKSQTEVQSAKIAAGGAAAQASYAETESDDRLYWTAEWAAMETELLQVKDAIEFCEGSTSQLELSAQAPSASAPTSSKKSADKLEPTLKVLKNLYENGKGNIAKLTDKEQRNKVAFVAKEEEHKTRLAQIAKSKSSAEFLRKETESENLRWANWERVRERQLKQFHAIIKIQNSMIEKEKEMVDLYEKIIAGKLDKVEGEKELARVSVKVAPETALLEFCREALGEVKAARDELR
jgi:flagellar biosynthesis GTPase FlhF